jgi:hypothetical protein
MGRVVRVAIAFSGLLALAGCDWIYGVERNAQLATLPDFDCVERVIRQSPGVAMVEHFQVADSGATLTGAALQPNAPINYFRYWGGTGSGIRGVIQLDRNEDGSATFGNYDLEMNREVPQSEIDATRPVMLAIERRLSEQCGTREIPAGIHEDCLRVECRALP